MYAKFQRSVIDGSVIFSREGAYVAVLQVSVNFKILLLAITFEQARETF